ncbi:uncharacterized protein TNCV_855502 [Trichonephila clavipes]|nr:uncharacterized protein TNCV_855502 [Trichonephila clavipes]
MITNFFIPELNNHDVQELWFQQDGATCHTARATIDLLKDTFGDRLISRFGPVNWPPRSCDLTPLDYFLWGYVKSLVYADKPQTLDHLEDNIRRVIADIRPQMLEKVIENWTSRLDYIRASRGRNEAAERLLHFSARLGLTQLSTHFLTLPGSQVALSSQNHERLLPEELAFKNGFRDLGQLLQYYRKQSTVFHPYKAALEQKEKVHPLVITTDIKQNSREIEHDIYELVKKKLALSDLESDDCDSEIMKELNTTKNGNLFQDLTTKLKDVHMFNTSNRSASLPRQAFRNQAPRYQARVLEDNLRRIRDIHEGIQRLRELNTKQIVVHGSSDLEVFQCFVWLPLA